MSQRSSGGLRLPGVLLPLVLSAQFLVLVPTAGAQGIAASALAEIQALEQEKSARTPAQEKIDSNLIYAHQKLLTGKASRAAPHLEPDIKLYPDGRVLVDITASVSEPLLAFIRQSGGQIISSFVQYNEIRALVPLPAVEAIADRPDVRFVSRAHEGHTNASSVDPEGDVCHEANLARLTFGADGTGLKVGVLSGDDSSNALAIAAGDLPPNVTTLPGQDGVSPVSDAEGTAMMEVIYRLAPGAQLFFATGLSAATYNPTNLGPSEAQMASNILALAAAGCSIIVDDIAYPDESPFQEGQPICQAVQTVSDQGVLYFSSARNSGNKDSANSGTWEGDFADGGAVGPPISGVESGRLHNFGGGTNYDTVTGVNGARADLFWSDPLGGSTNDYDLFLLDSSGASVVASSTTTQNGKQDPYEDLSSFSVNQRLVIVLRSGTGRFLHLDSGRSQIAINTAGNVRGHNCSSAANAFCVAATPASTGQDTGPSGPFPNPFTGGSANYVEFFSSDGPRRLFYYPNGTPITPGNFSSTGGALISKPDFTAADGVSTSMPVGKGLNPFFGTSCAAPHAAAIAALLLSYNPTLTPAQVRIVLTNTALPVTVDTARTAGAGIIMAYQALASVSANIWTNNTGGKWEVGSNWSINKPPDQYHSALISNGPGKTVTIDATTSGSFSASLTMLGLTVSSPPGSANTLFLNNAGVATPLTVINGAAQTLTSGRLIMETNAVVAVNHSAILLASNLDAGKVGGNTSLIITNGGTLTNVTGFVAVNGSSSNNAILVSGPGSIWNNSGPIELGENGAGNTLTILNGGLVSDSVGHIGFNSSSSGNTVLVSGPGSIWNNFVDLELGESGASNSLTIASGAVVFNTIGNLGFNSSSLGNTLLVNGSGALWTNRQEVNVGVSGPANTLLVTNGGAVIDPIGLLGFNGSSGNNTAQVTGNGSVWNNLGNLLVGQNGASNQLLIANNGLVLAQDVFVGWAATNPANQITITSGSLYVTNPLGNSLLDVRNGAVTLNSGTVLANQLLLTNGLNSVFTFNGGLLANGSATVNNGQTFAVGDGTDPATFGLLGGALPNLLGGVYSFAGGLEIRSNAFLTGCGIVNGNVTVDAGGTVQADCGDTLNFFGAVTINGTMTALNGTFINFYGPVVNNGTLNATAGFVRFFSTFQNNGTALTNPMVAMPVLTPLYSFMGPPDGANPWAPLIQATDGNFYGTTVNGGAHGLGTMFRITPAGAVSNLYSFTGAGNDGANPVAGLLQASDGFLYGSTVNGGAMGGPFMNIPLGTLFKMSTNGAYIWVLDFNGSIGYQPYGPLMQASDGFLYGTASEGGSSYNPGTGDTGSGTLFRLTLAGALTNLYSIYYLLDGTVPTAGLVQGSDGFFYGSTFGLANSCGSLFKINLASGGPLTVLQSCAGKPFGTIVQGSDGSLYGTTTIGGWGQGSVFRINSAGGVATLHSFTNFVGEGAVSYGGLMEGSDGNFYGTTYQGGIANTGTVFRITPSGALTTVYGFTGGTDGALPRAGLVRATDGNFYGTTSAGGQFGFGTVFKLSVYLVPPTNQLNQITGIKVAGTDVLISTTSIAGKAYQLQRRSSFTTGGWFNVPGAATNALGGPLTLIDPGGISQTQAFYRLSITP